MDEEYDVIVLGTGLTVSNQDSFALRRDKEDWLCELSRDYLSQTRPAILHLSEPRSESLLHPCAPVTLENRDIRCASETSLDVPADLLVHDRSLQTAGYFLPPHRRLSVVLHPGASFRRNPTVCHGPLRTDRPPSWGWRRPEHGFIKWLSLSLPLLSPQFPPLITPSASEIRRTHVRRD